MKLEQFGTYLDRPVFIRQTEEFEDLVNVDISNSVTLVWFVEQGLESDQLIAGLDALMRNNPLSITIGGEESDGIFSLLLDLLSRFQSLNHIMTAHSFESVISDAIKVFLSSTWPAEERFDEWEGYHVILVGGEDTLLDYLANALHLESAKPKQ
jgi:hypothetical protein